ncbi:MAG: two-component regulator propeller domain-containing protein [Bacteroidia bacterium]
MKRFLSYCLLFIICLATQHLNGQSINLGIPLITHFSKMEYQGGIQNWDFGQDNEGRLFVANNNGLMIFTGNKWKILSLPNKTILRSVQVDKKGRIFAGGQGILGYYEQTHIGVWEYMSLNAFVPKTEQNFADVWEIEQFENSIFFRTSDRVFRYANGSISVVYTGGLTTRIANVNGQLFMHARKEGLLKFTENRFVPVSDQPLLLNDDLTAIIPYENDAAIIASFRNGLFLLKEGKLTPYKSDYQEYFSEHRLNTAVALDQGRIALGTADIGVIVLDKAGRFVFQLDKQKGLQNSSVRSLFKDETGNLWVGLENGIDLIHTNSPFTYFLPDNDLESPAYSIAIFKDNLYVGLSSGLYQTAWKPYYSPNEGSKFKQIPGSGGQVWGLNIVDNKHLFLAHHEGVFEVKDKQLKSLSGPDGIWSINKIHGSQDSLIAGSYQGLSLYQKQGGEWKYVRKIGDFGKSSRFVVHEGNNRLWVSHPYRGVFAIDNFLDKTPSVQLFEEGNGLPSNNLNHIFTVNNEQIVAGETGIFKYLADADSFVIHHAYKDLFEKDERIIRLVSTARGDVWFITDQATGFLKVEDQGIERSVRKITFPEVHGQHVAGFEHIYPYDDHNVFFGASKGVIHLDASRILAPDTAWSVLLESVSILPKDSLGRLAAGDEADFPRSVTGLRFVCAATEFSAPSKTKFRYKIKGLDKGWSSWSSQPLKEYNNLPSGHFSFHYEAINMAGDIKSGTPFSFSIAPPWYASPLAFGVYGLLVLLGILALILVPQRAYKKEKAYLQTVHKRKEETHLRELEQSERARAELENERLEDEVRFKTTELASTTMHLVQKNELLIKIKSELESLKKRTDAADIAKDLGSLVRLLEHDIRLDDDWEQFSHHFDQVHRDFVSRLIKAHPQLTPNDHRLCAYLRMNLSSKEIAPLMNISVRGVEVSRYRLRKKLNLSSEVNLTEMMMGF